MSVVLGVDAGGTFTDLVAVDEVSGSMTFLKVPTVPTHPDQAVVAAVARSGIEAADVSAFAHGTTVATNTVIERTGARVGLLTTQGFEDILEIGRGDRERLYDLAWTKPRPLVPRHLRKGVRERMNHRGEILEALDEESMRIAVEELRAQRVDVLAICFLHSYANPLHEQRARDFVAGWWPEVHVSLSSDVLSEFREFERVSTVVVDAYVKPRIADYVQLLASNLTDIGVDAPLAIMKSSGGIMTTAECVRLPVNTLMSGPAGGVVAATHVAVRAGFADVITLDIGGTSADAALVHAGSPLFTTQQEIEWGLPVKVPMIDVRTIGAGGGSIAWIDRGGRLKVGPHSAGAEPGPASYCRGGEEPTVTDANLLLGYLNPDYFVGGDMTLDVVRARNAVQAKVCDPTGLCLEDAAQGIIDIVNENMKHLIRQISVQQGYDPRDFALVAFGGGGAVHASALAESLGISTVLVPGAPGVLSAFGLVLADPRSDLVRSHLSDLTELDWGDLLTVFSRMEERVRQTLEGTRSAAHRVERLLDMRYARQNYEVRVPFDPTNDVASLAEAFHTTYEHLYGYSMRDQPVEVVNCRVAMIAQGQRRFHDQPELVPGDWAAADKGTRHAYFREWGEHRECRVIERARITGTTELPAPCIIEQPDTAVVISPRDAAHLDAHGNIVIRVGARED